jgi:transmembrane sensor
MSTPEDDEELKQLSRYAAGEGSPEERAALRSWIEESPDRAAIVAAMSDIARIGDPEAAGWDTRSAWRALATRLSLPTNAASVPVTLSERRTRPARQTPQRRPKLALLESKPRTRWHAMALAAAAAILFTAAGSFALWRSDHPAPSQAAAEGSWREYATRRGQRATVELLDGTHIDLGVDSRLRVRMPDAGTREIVLEGEAVFEVAHDSLRPLTVRAGNALMMDIGTRFNVRAYPNGGDVQVVVASGMVQLSDTAGDLVSGLLLSAGDMGSIDESGVPQLSRGIDTTRFFAWAEGRLVFDRTPLREAAARLERWYDIEVLIPDSSIASRRLTATIAAQNVEEVLGAVTLPLHLRYERHGRVVVIEPRSSGAGVSRREVTNQSKDGRSR